MSTATLAATQDIDDIIYEQDDATRMLALMERRGFSMNELRSMINYGIHEDSVALNLLALAKNKSLGAGEVSMLWREMLDDYGTHRNYQAGRYLINHPSLSKGDVLHLAEALTYGEEHWSNLDPLAQVMTSPHLPARQWKSIARIIVRNYFDDGKRQCCPMLSGARNVLDPTALMGEEPLLSGEQLAYLYEQSRKSKKDTIHYMRRAIMSHPNVPSDLREKVLLGYKDNPIILSGLASNPTVTDREMEVLKHLFYTSATFRKHGIVPLARNPKTFFLDQISTWTRSEMRGPNEGHNRMWHLTIQSSILLNPSTSDELFNKTLTGVPGSLLKLLRREHSPDFFLLERTTPKTRHAMMAALAENSIIPPDEWIEKLGLDKVSALDIFDATEPLAQIGKIGSSDDQVLLAHAAKSTEFDVREAVARNKHTPLEVLKVLEVDEDSEVRSGVASNTAAPEDMLLRLAHDSAFDVKRVLAQHNALPGSVQRALATDKNWKVRNYLLRYGKPSKEIRNQLKKDPRIIRGGF